MVAVQPVDQIDMQGDATMRRERLEKFADKFGIEGAETLMVVEPARFSRQKRHRREWAADDVAAVPDQSTEPGARKSLLECKDGSWQDYRAEYPNSDRWLSTGPELVLHGQGVRNPEFMAGHWTGTPQESDAICHATYVQGGDDNPKITQTHEVNGDAGKPVEFEAPVRLFTVTLTGNCLWERSE